MITKKSQGWRAEIEAEWAGYSQRIAETLHRVEEELEKVQKLKKETQELHHLIRDPRVQRALGHLQQESENTPNPQS